MTEAARGLALALEAAQPFRVRAHFGAQHLDDDAVAQQDVARTMERAHAAARDEGFDVVLPVEHLPDLEWRRVFEHRAVVRAEARRALESAAALGTEFHVLIKRICFACGPFAEARRACERAVQNTLLVRQILNRPTQACISLTRADGGCECANGRTSIARETSKIQVSSRAAPVRRVRQLEDKSL